MTTDLSRRTVMTGLLGTAAAVAMAGPAAALDVTTARQLIGHLVDEINKVINSGESEQQMFKDFEGIFSKYADVPIIARSALGVAARRASPQQMREFTDAFRGYLARKYGRRFREFIGGKIIVKSARKIKSFYEVDSIAKLRGEAPFDLRWHVSDRSGRNLFFNLIIDGVNMLATERSAIGAMLDQNNGNIDKLIAELKKSG